VPAGRLCPAVGFRRGAGEGGGAGGARDCRAGGGEGGHGAVFAEGVRERLREKPSQGDALHAETSRDERAADGRLHPRQRRAGRRRAAVPPEGDLRARNVPRAPRGLRGSDPNGAIRRAT
jgi:hypothetical protein